MITVQIQMVIVTQGDHCTDTDGYSYTYKGGTVPIQMVIVTQGDHCTDTDGYSYTG